jgi:citrate lyase subunit beta/citryl-CoA lyase
VEHDRFHESLLLASGDGIVFLCLTSALMSTAMPRTLAFARSFLFAPGSDEGKLRKAVASGADAVIADLEDSVTEGEKGAARELVARVLPAADGTALRLARVNAPGTPHFEADVRGLSEARLDGLVLPKATPEAVAALGAEGPPVVAIVETAQGLRRAYETASAPRVAALMLGAVDLGLELGLEPRADGQEILFARSRLVLDSAAAGRRAPIDRVWTDLRDSKGLEADARLARSLGLRGKACVHPSQVEIVNHAFSPSDAELARAARVVAAAEAAAAEGRGAVALDGEMIDAPVVERARQLLADAERRSPHVD